MGGHSAYVTLPTDPPVLASPVVGETDTVRLWIPAKPRQPPGQPVVLGPPLEAVGVEGRIAEGVFARVAP